jgi:hypothetical protein
MAAIYYFFPDIATHSAGIRILYRHVEVLVQHGFKASMLHVKPGFQMPDVPQVPTAFTETYLPLTADDVIVVPEPYPNVMATARRAGARCFAIALNWDYIYGAMPADSDWRALGVERVLTHSPMIADFVTWCMKLPTTVFHWGVNPTLYHATDKISPELVYIERKQDRIHALQNIYRSRNPRLVRDIKWTALNRLSEAEYAAIIRNAFAFLSLSRAEGLPCSHLEAMRCRTLVAGYNSVGAQRELIGHGPKQNAILAETMDYVDLAMKLEPILTDLLKGDVSAIQPVIDNAYTLSQQYDRQSEEQSIIAMWREFLGSSAKV